MKETKFTKGEWEINQYGTITCNGETVKVPGVSLPCFDDEESIANSKLVAAAPEMYAMLERTASIIKMAEETDYQCYGAEMREDVAAINELLAKARGE